MSKCSKCGYDTCTVEGQTVCETCARVLSVRMPAGNIQVMHFPEPPETCKWKLLSMHEIYDKNGKLEDVICSLMACKATICILSTEIKQYDHCPYCGRKIEVNK